MASHPLGERVVVKGDTFVEWPGGKEGVLAAVEGAGASVMIRPQAAALGTTVRYAVVSADWAGTSAGEKWCASARAAGVKLLAPGDPEIAPYLPAPAAATTSAPSADSGASAEAAVTGRKRSTRTRTPSAAAKQAAATEAAMDHDEGDGVHPSPPAKRGRKAARGGAGASAGEAEAPTSGPTTPVVILRVDTSARTSLLVPCHGTMHDLKRAVVGHFDDVHEPGAVRLVYRGKEYPDTTTLSSAGVIGSPTPVIVQVRQVAEHHRATKSSRWPASRKASGAGGRSALPHPATKGDRDDGEQEVPMAVHSLKPKPRDVGAADETCMDAFYGKTDVWRGLAYAGGALPPPVPGDDRQGYRWRMAPSSDIRDRLQRANTQRMFLVDRQPLVGDEFGFEFSVLGSTGNLYRVRMQGRPSCTCPDARRGICKHVIFVMIKVLRIPPTCPLVWQDYYMQHELRYIFDHAPDPSRDRVVLADDAVRVAAAAATGRALELTAVSTAPVAAEGASATASAVSEERRKPVVPSDDCGICFDELGSDRSLLTWCTTCGNNMHTECMTMWARSKAGGTVTCVYCRSPWVNPTAAPTPVAASGSGVKVNRDGRYLNFASSLGLSGKRDTSTYHTWGKKRAWGYYA